MGNAIKSSLHGASLKSNKEGSRSIQVEITPTASRISRNAVTSLSIRGHRWKRHGERPTAVDDERLRSFARSGGADCCCGDSHFLKHQTDCYRLFPGSVSIPECFSMTLQCANYSNNITHLPIGVSLLLTWIRLSFTSV